MKRIKSSLKKKKPRKTIMLFEATGRKKKK